MAIKTYPKGSKEQLSENFKAYEFDCHGDGCCTETKIDLDLVARLQVLRNRLSEERGYDVPIYINSGFRCEEHNAAVGGARASYHMKGMAADIRSPYVTPEEMAKTAESVGFLGIGLYDNFVHVDTRTSKFFWYGQQCEPRTTFGGAPEATEAPTATVTVELPVLRKGSNGDTVEALQIMLKGRGYNLGNYGPNKDGIDGHFGNATENAVMSFQEDMELDNDRSGIVGALEWRALLGLGG